MRAGPRSRASRLAFAAALGLAAVGFAALGLWQVERGTEKLDLIARVESRIAAPPSPIPDPAAWPAIDARDAYRRVTAAGRFLPVRPALVQAVTEHGAGFWAILPFRTESGATILVNRGFVPANRREVAEAGASDATRVTGLLRVSEPGGGFLRSNDPGADRWYSRDVAAIAESRGLGPVAPFFVDADASANRDGAPVGGLTVIAFRNAHAVYAATWFALALLAAGFAAVAWRGRAG